MKSSDIKRVIDDCMPEVTLTEDEIDAMLHRFHKKHLPPKPNHNKLPIVAAVVLVLILIGTVAFAAMSLLGVFEEAFHIQAEEDGAFINDWTLEHKLELVDLIVNAGVSLDQEKLEPVYGDELTDEEKGELIIEVLMDRFPPIGGGWVIDPLSMLISEKGSYYDRWTHEERAWMNEQLGVGLDGPGYKRYVIPTDDDLSEAKAYEIAYRYYEEEYGLSKDCFDTSSQTAEFYERMTEDYTIDRNWGITLYLTIDYYDGQELRWKFLPIEIGNDGTILDPCEPLVRTWEDDWFDTRFSDDFWTVESMYEFQQNWRSRVEELLHDNVTMSRDLKYLISKEYGLPGENDLSYEEAYAIAKATVLAQPNWTEEMLDLYYGTRAAYLIGEPNVYDIVFTTMEAPSIELLEKAKDVGLDLPISIRVCLDSESGEIIEIYQNDANRDMEEIMGI